MLSQTILTALVTLPIFLTRSEDNYNASLVTYYNQLPSEIYDDDAEISAIKDVLYIRNDINILDPKNGPDLACRPQGQVTLAFDDKKASDLDSLAKEYLLGHPIIVPPSYDSSACPDLADHTILGPKKYVPADALADLDQDDDFTVLIPLTEADVHDNEITFSVRWATYHNLVGVIGDAPDNFPWLAQDVEPWSDETTSSSRIVRRRVRGGFGRGLGRILGGIARDVVTGTATDVLGDLILGR